MIHAGCFSKFVNKMRDSHKLIVQPRMGFSDIAQMRAGLLAVKHANAICAGTITLDSYTRVNQHEMARQAVQKLQQLNGFPLVAYGKDVTNKLLQGILDADFPVQVRHGTALPLPLFETMVQTRLDATEGGPISYCLPYSRIALTQSIDAWMQCCHLFAQKSNADCRYHLESFAGCMLGQLCHPSILIALTILEGLFFTQHGIRSISLSFTQGTSCEQDIAALLALRKLATHYFHGIDWHLVFYTFMGVFPKTVLGTYRIITDSARIAAYTNTERLIIKTPLEAYRIPTIAENVAALELGFQASQSGGQLFKIDTEEQERIFNEAETLITAVLNCHPNINQALQIGFNKGYLDIPYCIHQDNHNLTRCFIDNRDYLCWASIGDLPLQHFKPSLTNRNQVKSATLLRDLKFIQNKYDR